MGCKPAADKKREPAADKKSESGADKKGEPAPDKKDGDGKPKPNAEKASLPKKDPAREAQLAAARDKKIQEAQKAEEKLIDGLKKAWPSKFELEKGVVARFIEKDVNLSAITSNGTHLVLVRNGVAAFEVLDLVSRKGREVQTGGKGISRLTIPPDNSLVVTQGLGDDAIKIWDLQKGTLKKDLARQTPAPIVLSPDNKHLAFWASDGHVRIIEWETGSERDLGEGNVGLSFSPDGKLFASSQGRDAEATMVLWEVASGGKIQEQKVGIDIEQVAFSPDGWTVAVASAKEGKRSLQLWDLEKNSLGKTLVTGKTEPSMVYSPDGKSLAFSTLVGMVLLDPASGKERWRTEGYLGNITFLQGGSLFATRVPDGDVILWSVPELLKSAPKN